MTERERFEQYVYPEPNSGCHLWAGKINSFGYGIFGIGSLKDGSRTQVRAHRYVYERVNGALPRGVFLRHVCDTPCCVNPDHLREGSHLDNMDDMVRRGRSKAGRGSLPFGVTRSRGRYASRISYHGRTIRLGTFDTIEEAAEVAARAKQRYRSGGAPGGGLPS